MVERYFARVQFENIPRNNNRFTDVMENVVSLIVISIKYEENLININILKNNYLVDEGFIANLFKKE